MSTADKLIEHWSSLLADRIVEIRFIDMAEMRSAIKVHIKSALYDCLKIQLPETQQELNATKIKYANTKGANQHIQSEIVLLKQKLKEQNKLYAELDVENSNKEMVIWMRKHNEEKLLEFYNYYNNKFHKPNNKSI